MQGDITTLFLTPQIIETYIQYKFLQGVKNTSCAKYTGTLNGLADYLKDKPITKEILARWRTYLTDKGYSKITIRKYITVINDFLR